MAHKFYPVVFTLLLLVLSQSVTAAADKAPPSKKDRNPPKGTSDADVSELEREALRCRVAADAVDLYRTFLARAQLSDRQTKAVNDRMKVWQGRVDRKLVRLGADWVTLDEARSVGTKADELIQQAGEKIKSGDFKGAKELLEKSAKADPSGIRADYYLAMLNSPNFWNYAPSAEKHFERSHRRDAQNASILNNLA